LIYLRTKKEDPGAVKKLLILPLLILLVPAHIRDVKTASSLVSSASPEREAYPLTSLLEYKETLLSRGQSLDDQGVLIESFDGQTVLDEHNPDITFNPASVMKLSTSLMALVKFGPSYRYSTSFLAGGAISTAERKLEGDLVVRGGADPMFSMADAQKAAAELSRKGISRVTGALRICGPFYYYARGYTSNLSRETSANKLRNVLEQAGIKIAGETIFGEPSGDLLVTHISDPLARILLYQNAHSSNAVAEVVGESVGGPQAIQSFLIDNLDLKDSEVYVGHASGLEFNRITPRASLKVLRGLLTVLSNHGLKPEDVMPVAGVDSGTLRARLDGSDFRGSVIAKTGTLVSLEGGVSTLVGIAYTKSSGPLLFAIFNSAGDVSTYRRLQDQFLERLITEKGGATHMLRSEDALGEIDGDSNSEEAAGSKSNPQTSKKEMSRSKKHQEKRVSSKRTARKNERAPARARHKKR
jgi:D-alanyl-D-alanine carboxypeptidase